MGDFYEPQFPLNKSLFFGMLTEKDKTVKMLLTGSFIWLEEAEGLLSLDAKKINKCVIFQAIASLGEAKQVSRNTQDALIYSIVMHTASQSYREDPDLFFLTTPTNTSHCPPNPGLKKKIKKKQRQTLITTKTPVNRQRLAFRHRQDTRVWPWQRSALHWVLEPSPWWKVITSSSTNNLFPHQAPWWWNYQEGMKPDFFFFNFFFHDASRQRVLSPSEFSHVANCQDKGRWRITSTPIVWVYRRPCKKTHWLVFVPDWLWRRCSQIFTFFLLTCFSRSTTNPVGCFSGKIKTYGGTMEQCSQV